MELEVHYCGCHGNHTMGHCKAGAGCNCFCFRCSSCGRWITKRYWPEHQTLTDCTPIVPPRPDERVRPETPADSFEKAMGDLGLVDEELFDQEFRVAMRKSVGVLIDMLAGIETGTIERTAAWRAVVNVILDPDQELESKVAELLTLFHDRERSEDLEAQIWAILANADELIPDRSLTQ